MSLNNRLQTYARLSTELSSYSDVKLLKLIDEASPLHTGIGGKSALLTINDSKVFIKKIPLTDLERQPRHVMSTANIFELPLFYQYGIGSAGFGAWRELLAHIMTSNWVVAQEWPHFPLMYHWRVLPTLSEDLNDEYWKDLESYVTYWEKSAAVRRRIEAIQHVTAHIIIFLEYVPQTLSQWLGDQLKDGGNIAEAAISFVDNALKETNEFMKAQGFFHFDAHFENILTNGKLIYLSDFGLALSSKFDLTESERTFLKVHQHYDRCSSIVNLLHCIITSLCGKNHWEVRLQELLRDSGSSLPLIPLIKKYAPIALIMDEFYQKLQKKSKSTLYPADRLEHFLMEIDQKN